LFSFLTPGKERIVDTNQHGEHRNFVMTGAFEQVLPMDILPMYLFKAIITEDFENMESLGIFELVEEDVALCEFIDVSKHPLQEILREGIEMVRQG
jgi:Na+-transporting NADH:ubiquinone oxidoreductase subunit A